MIKFSNIGCTLSLDLKTLNMAEEKSQLEQQLFTPETTLY